MKYLITCSLPRIPIILVFMVTSLYGQDNIEEPWEVHMNALQPPAQVMQAIGIKPGMVIDDMAIMVLVFHMIEDPDPLLENIKHSLKPGANLIILDPVDKEIARDFLMLTSSGDAAEAFTKYAGPGFKHHNIYFKGNARTLMAAMEENAKKNPEMECSKQAGKLC